MLEVGEHIGWDRNRVLWRGQNAALKRHRKPPKYADKYAERLTATVSGIDIGG